MLLVCRPELECGTVFGAHGSPPDWLTAGPAACPRELLLAVLGGDALDVEADAMAPGWPCDGFQSFEAKCRRDLMSQDVVALRRDIECERAAAGACRPSLLRPFRRRQRNRDGRWGSHRLRTPP